MTDGKKTILIVEDEASLLAALTEKLRHEGFRVLQAKNGQEGLDCALINHPDLILLDIIMPVMDGMTMLHKLRKSGDWGKSAHVIILTNLSSDAERISYEVTTLEPAFYLVKADWTLEDLLEKVKETLGLTG